MNMMPIINMIKTGENITRIRKDKGMTVKELQDIFGFATPNAIYKWQNGMAMPTIDNLVILSKVFDVSMDELIVVDNLIIEKISA